MEDQSNVIIVPDGKTEVKNEFDKDAIVVRYGKNGATYFTGLFNEKGEGIFEPFPNKE